MNKMYKIVYMGTPWKFKKYCQDSINLTIIIV